MQKAICPFLPSHTQIEQQTSKIKEALKKNGDPCIRGFSLSLPSRVLERNSDIEITVHRHMLFGEKLSMSDELSLDITMGLYFFKL